MPLLGACTALPHSLVPAAIFRAEIISSPIDCAHTAAYSAGADSQINTG